MTLKLQYRCTEAESKEGKKLQEYDYYGRGSKWRGRLVLGALVVFGFVATAVRFKQEIAPQDRPWFIGLCLVAIVVLLVFKRITRRKTDAEVSLELSEHGLILGAGDGRTTMLWSGFSQCLESPNLFVLVNRPKTLLYIVPKRAFPDESARDWFRAQANQPKGPAESATPDALVPGRFVATNGIALTLRLKLRDYFNRNFTSWRMRGIFFFLLAMVTAISCFTTPPPDAVVSPQKVYLLMVAAMFVLMLVMVIFFSLYFWVMERKHREAQHLVVNDAGIEFVARDSNGRLPWSTYKYYLENRWSFFLWQPQGSIWLMLPKRDFASPSDLAQFRELLHAKLKRSRWFYL